MRIITDSRPWEHPFVGARCGSTGVHWVPCSVRAASHQGRPIVDYGKTHSSTSGATPPGWGGHCFRVRFHVLLIGLLLSSWSTFPGGITEIPWPLTLSSVQT